MIRDAGGFMLLYLVEDGQSSRKYALQAFYLIYQVYSLLSPQAAHRLIWNRFVKKKHGPGGNIPLNLSLEHFNRLIKILIAKHLVSTRDNFDRMCTVTRRSGKHVRRSTDGDLRKVVHELVEHKALQYHTGRSYIHFLGVKDSLLANLDIISI